MDAVVPHQYGFKNVVAVIGSAITEKHIRQIKKLTRRVALALDPDAAGESATLRGITVAQEAFDRVAVPVPTPSEGAPRNRRGEYKGVVRFEEQVDAQISVVRLPPHEDPDELVRRDPEGWRRAVAQAQPLIDFLIEARTADLDLASPHGKIEAARRLLPVIAELRDRTLADEYIGRLASRIRLEKVDLARDLVQLRRRQPRPALQRGAPPAEPEEAAGEDWAGASVDQLGEKYPASGRKIPSPSYSASGTASGRPASGAGARLLAEQAQEEYCLGLLIEHPEAWAEVYGILREGDFASAEARALFAALRPTQLAPAAGDPRAVLVALPSILQTAAERARSRVAGVVLDEGLALSKAVSLCAYRIKRTRLKEAMAELDYLERDAEGGGDAEALRALLQRKLQLLSQRRALDVASGLHG
jgi:DNA primase